VGRKRLWGERLVIRFPAGTRARIDAARKRGEDRSDIIRRGLERELKRLERQKGKKL
jgi:hypothetical protein